MRIGLLGAGRIGSRHALVLAAHPAVTSMLVADQEAGRAEALAESLPSAASIDGVEDVIAQVDALLIATPTPSHAALLAKAAAAGLPVFCEKPFADSLPRSKEIVARLAESGVPVQVGFQRRFDVGYLAARTALRAGEIGELRRAHVITCDPAPPPREFIATSGGIFRDCNIHDFDALRWLTGLEVEQVFATGANRGHAWFREHGDVDEAAAVLTLAGGTLATVQGSRYNGAGYDVRMELAGTVATLVVGLDEHTPMHSAEPGVAAPAGPTWRSFWDRFQPAYEAEINAFVDLARGEIASPCTAQDGLEALYIAEAAEVSRREGRPVAVAEMRQDGIA